LITQLLFFPLVADGAAFSFSTRFNVLLVAALLHSSTFYMINNVGKHRIRTLWAIPWDATVPFMPGFIYIYFSTYLLGAIPFLLIADPGPFVAVVLGNLIFAFSSAIIHIAFPSRVVRFEDVQPTDHATRLIYWFQHTFKPHGSFPSMHVGFSVLAACATLAYYSVWWGLIFWVWAILVAISTLVTKQHYVLDALAGTALALAVFSLMIFAR
jgi:membrane-associated phospholipid phosphatase